MHLAALNKWLLPYFTPVISKMQGQHVCESVRASVNKLQTRLSVCEKDAKVRGKNIIELLSNPSDVLLCGRVCVCV